MRLLWSFLALTALTATALAQVDWTEQGDAGDLPETAQATGTDTNTPLSSISGALAADDVDMFAIYIADPSAFQAETNTTTTDFDSQLWLFDVNGNGIVHDDDSAGNYRSRITNANNCIPGPGIYYIAISSYNRDPRDCNDIAIWTSASNACAVAGRSRVASWTGSTSAGTYQIVLQGAFTAPLGADPADCPPFDGWDETANGGGDAGDLPETAQSTGSDSITKIRGTIGGANDVDVYAIYISDPGAFSATTIGGTTLDTALWLFDENGKGVVHNEDDPDASTGFQSRIDNRTNCITQPGRYYLAVSLFGRRAAGCSEGLIWATTPFRGVRCPDGPESTSRVGGWSGSSSSTGRYIIFLTGVSGATAGDPADCPPQLPREFTLTDGDATFTLRGIRGVRTTTSGGLGDYKSLSGTGVPDHMFQNWWWYRTDSDTREFALSNLTAFEQPQANTVSLTYAEGGLTYEITYTLSDPGDNQAVVVAQLTIANTTSTPITLNLFNYSDFDMDGSFGGDRAELVRPGYIRVYETNTAHIVTAETPFAWQISAFSDVRDLLTDTDIDDLNNSGSPFGPGDFTGAFQWQYTLNAGASRSLQLLLTLNVEPPTCQQHNGDVDNNGCVDDADLLAVLFAFGQTGDNLGRVDVNCDQVVDDADLLQVLFNFGSGC
jgi:uncharacterized Zn-binding protein involved in type VI secretion